MYFLSLPLFPHEGIALFLAMHVALSLLHLQAVRLLVSLRCPRKQCLVFENTEHLTNLSLAASPFLSTLSSSLFPLSLSPSLSVATMSLMPCCSWLTIKSSIVMHESNWWDAQVHVPIARKQNWRWQTKHIIKLKEAPGTA